MNITKEKNIGELVAEDYRASAIFQKYQIDFCCKGNRSIGDACAEKKVNAESLVQDMNAVLNMNRQDTIDFQSWPLDLLADYIEKIHHRYVEETTPLLMRYLDKLCSVHGGRHPELIEIRELFGQSAMAMAAHMKKEELVLFPFIRKMVASERMHQEMPHPHFGTVQNPVQMMIHEHTTEGERFQRISQISNHYTPPEDACNTYKVTFKFLQEYENDLHLHIHLENNILFPGAVRLENKFSAATI